MDLIVKYENQILDEYVYSEDQSKRFYTEDPWTEYLEDLMSCAHRHRDTLGAYNDTQPTEQFLKDWERNPQTLKDLRQEARETANQPSIGWMFETNQTTLAEMCERTHLDYAPWLTEITQDHEYPKILRNNESRLKKIAEAMIHLRYDEAQLLTPEGIHINWNLTFVHEKDRLDVNNQ